MVNGKPEVNENFCWKKFWVFKKLYFYFFMDFLFYLEKLEFLIDFFIMAFFYFTLDNASQESLKR